jgi:hypothetical protein
MQMCWKKQPQQRPVFFLFSFQLFILTHTHTHKRERDWQTRIPSVIQSVSFLIEILIGFWNNLCNVGTIENAFVSPIVIIRTAPTKSRLAIEHSKVVVCKENQKFALLTFWKEKWIQKFLFVRFNILVFDSCFSFRISFSVHWDFFVHNQLLPYVECTSLKWRNRRIQWYSQCSFLFVFVYNILEEVVPQRGSSLCFSCLPLVWESDTTNIQSICRLSTNTSLFDTKTKNERASEWLNLKVCRYLNEYRIGKLRTLIPRREIGRLGIWYTTFPSLSTE